MSFKMKCPKCESISYSVERDTRTYATGKSGELVFSCRCGKQLFGDQLTAEYDRQKSLWEADPARRAVASERETRLREEEARQEALRQAFEYRRAWVAQRRAGSTGEMPPAPRVAPQPERPAAGREANAAREAAPTQSARRPIDPRAIRPAAQSASGGALAQNRAEPARREQASQTPVATEAAGDTGDLQCEWAGCPNHRAPNSKYCSRACSNKNARLRHSRRKKGSHEVAA